MGNVFVMIITTKWQPKTKELLDPSKYKELSGNLTPRILFKANELMKLSYLPEDAKGFSEILKQNPTPAKLKCNEFTKE